MEEDEILIFLARSKLRKQVLLSLGEKPQIASFLAHKMGKHREVISRVFLNLQRKGLAICRNPQSPHFRYYKITEFGEKVLKELN